MTKDYGTLSACLMAALILVYVLDALVFIRFRTPASADRKKAPRTVIGAVLVQSLGYAAAWNLRRGLLDPFRTHSLALAVGLTVISVGLALAGVALVAWAKKTLGRQWGLAARVVKGHELVTSGPFRFVRHPLYLGMGFLLLGAIAGLSSTLGAGLALVLYAAGTTTRIRIEDKLLAETFGPKFEAYRRRVPAFFPRPFNR
jgi:protein-S-isoprenylcysteine O-methyltransferase Ste14